LRGISAAIWMAIRRSFGNESKKNFDRITGSTG